MTHFVCDRCRQPIPAGRSAITVKAVSGPAWCLETPDLRSGWDLCPECLAGLLAYLRAPAEAVESRS